MFINKLNWLLCFLGFKIACVILLFVCTFNFQSICDTSLIMPPICDDISYGEVWGQYQNKSQTQILIGFNSTIVMENICKISKIPGVFVISEKINFTHDLQNDLQNNSANFGLMIAIETLLSLIIIFQSVYFCCEANKRNNKEEYVKIEENNTVYYKYLCHTILSIVEIIFLITLIFCSIQFYSACDSSFKIPHECDDICFGYIWGYRNGTLPYNKIGYNVSAIIGNICEVAKVVNVTIVSEQFGFCAEKSLKFNFTSGFGFIIIDLIILLVIVLFQCIFFFIRFYEKLMF